MIALHIIAFLPVIFMGRSRPLGFFSFTGEFNLPSMYSVFLLWNNALFIGWIAWAERRSRLMRIYWLGLAAAFILAGLDEGLMIHEQIRDFFCATNIIPVGGAPWLETCAVIALLPVLLLYWRFFKAVPVRTCKRMLMATIVLLAGAIGFDFLGHAWAEIHGKDAVCYILDTIEEVLEMVGSIVFIYAFTGHLQLEFPGMTIGFSAPDSGNRPS